MTDFAKTFADEPSASEAVRRSMALRAQGLATPAARCEGRMVLFDRLDGVSGLALEQTAPDPWLRPLAQLHLCHLDGLSLAEPLRRIRPRNALLTSSVLADALSRLAESPPRGTTLLHGDFHLGQLIRDDAGQVWMVDLDDLCLGPPEADLANLIANLATQSRLPGNFSSRLAQCRSGITRVWTCLGLSCREPVLDHHLALALIRRHLKLREAGRLDFVSDIERWVSPVADRICPSGSAAYPG